jgi:multiple sugar transport system substrate-binding protein
MKVKGLLVLALAFLTLSYAQTEVVWWDFLGGGDGIRMKKLIDDFNASHDDIKINVVLHQGSNLGSRR